MVPPYLKKMPTQVCKEKLIHVVFNGICVLFHDVLLVTESCFAKLSEVLQSEFLQRPSQGLVLSAVFQLMD